MSESTAEKRLITTKDLALMGLCVAFIAICAFMTIPTAVPFTLQTFAIFFVLLIPPGRDSGERADAPRPSGGEPGGACLSYCRRP